MGMKKIGQLLLFMAFIFLAACGSNQGNTVSEAGEKGPDHVIRFVHEEQIDSVQQSYVEEFKKSSKKSRMVMCMLKFTQ